MNKKYISIALFFIVLSVFGQSPEKMSYQAVVRDANSDLIFNTQVGMRMSILQGSINGSVVYEETLTPSTNVNGLVSVELGSGIVVSGDFSGIDWTNGPYYIKTETDPTGGTNYSITGTSQLLSVPYALYAKSAGSTNETDPKFTANFDLTNPVDGDILQYDATAEKWIKQTISGDVTIDNTGATVLGDDIVTTSKLVEASVTNTKLDKTNIPISGFAAATAQLDMGNQRITNIENPTNAQDAVTKDYLDNQGYLSQVPSESRSIIITPGMIDLDFSSGDGVSKVRFGGWLRPALQLTDEFNDLDFNFPMPSDWNGEQITLKVLFSTSDSGEEVVIDIGNSGVSLGEDSEDSTSGVSPEAVPGSTTSNELMEYSKQLFTEPADRMVQVVFRRRGDDSRDTSSGDMFVFGFTIEYNTK